MNEQNMISSIKRLYFSTSGIVAFFTLFDMGFFWLALFAVAQWVKGEPAKTIYGIRTVFMVAIPVVGVGFIAVLMFSCYKRVKLVRGVEPRSFTVEDFIITQKRTFSGVRNMRGGRFIMNPVLKDEATGELFCAFGRYNKSVYATVRSQDINTLHNAIIVRRDGSELDIGDTVMAYIKSFADVKISIEADGKYRVGDESCTFSNINSSYDITMLNDLRFFVGMIDVERENEF